MVSPRHHPGEGRVPVGGRRQLRVARRYHSLPNWAPAFAGVVLGCWAAGPADLEFSAWQIQKKAASQQEAARRSGQWIPQNPPRRRPGPSWGTEVVTRCPPLPRHSQLGPGLRQGGAAGWAAGRADLVFSALRIQEKGRLPARSGLTFWSVDTPKSTPAKAGAQLGDRGNYVLPAFTTAFPTGPRPPPGWCWGLAPRQACIRGTESENAPPQSQRARGPPKGSGGVGRRSRRGSCA